jgi:membrane-associated protein
MMLNQRPASPKRVLRFLVWGCAVAVVWAIWRDLAFAHGTIGAAQEEEEGFVASILRSIFTFDTNGLMRTLGKPEYSIPAFIVLNLIVYTETGLLIGFFLPGDSLLVITGLICAHESCEWSVPLLLVTLSASAIIGDTVGYWIGFSTGPKIFNREQSFFFHKDHLIKAQAFYEKHGGKTIILARFIPILRTFAPVVAGVGKMEYRQFLTYNIVGGIGWVFSMVLAGYFLPSLVNEPLAKVFGTGFQIERHVEKVVIVVVFLSITPGIYAWLKSKLSKKANDPVKNEEPVLSGK